MSNVEQSPISYELTILPEREGFQNDFQVITISGRSGTMKSSTMRELGEKLGIPFESRGDEFRNNLKEKDAFVGELLDFAPRPSATDILLDMHTGLAIVEAVQNNIPRIIEARLGAVVLRELQRSSLLATQTGESPKTLSVLLTSDEYLEEEQCLRRFRRIHKRMRSDTDSPSLQDIGIMTENREKGDFQQWQSIYGHILRGQDPFDPNYMDQDGNLIYDLVLHVDGDAPGDVANTIFLELENRNYITKVDKDNRE